MLALVVALLCVPAFASDYTPWPPAEGRLVMSQAIELAQQGKSSCKRRSKGQPCGNTCISEEKVQEFARCAR